MPHADPNVKREYMKKYRRERYANDPAYRETIKAASRRTPREVWRAHAAVKRGLLRGEIVKPLFCERCSSAGALEAAHEDYAKPLLIHWLCRFCHRRWDKDEPKFKAAS